MTTPETITAARIHPVQASARTLWHHVVLDTDGGLQGVGEASLHPFPDGFRDTLASAANAMVGRSLDDTVMAPLAPLLARGLGARTIHAAMEQAVCDLRAQSAGIALFRLLAPDAAPRPVAIYANINRVTIDRTPAGFAASAERAVGHGQRSLKIAAFDGLSPDLCATSDGAALIETGLARLAAVARTGADVRVDCHWRFTPEAAHRLLPRLSEIGVGWLECPLREVPGTIPELRRLRSAANARGIRLAGLETFGGWDEVAPFVEGGAYDVVMPDVKHVGRLCDILDIASRARRHGVATSLHNPSGPVSHLVSTHVATALGGDERMEVQWAESPRFLDITDPAPRFDGDTCRVEDASGIGARFVGQCRNP